MDVLYVFCRRRRALIVPVANSHVLKALHGWFAPLSGKGIYNKPAVEASKADFLKAASLLEKTLADKTFLVGHRVTLADIFIASAVGRGFDCVRGSRKSVRVLTPRRS